MNLKEIYDSYTGKKCSYNRFYLRTIRWASEDKAILPPRKYGVKKEDKIESLEKQIAQLIEKRSKHQQGSKKYSVIQEKKNKLVRELSVYKSR